MGSGCRTYGEASEFLSIKVAVARRMGSGCRTFYATAKEPGGTDPRVPTIDPDAEPTIEEAEERLREYLLHTHAGVGLEDLEPTGMPGCWELKQPCKGKEGGCRNVLHLTTGRPEPMRHEICFVGGGRAPNGRWTGTYTVWRVLRRKHESEKPT